MLIYSLYLRFAEQLPELAEQDNDMLFMSIDVVDLYR